MRDDDRGAAAQQPVSSPGDPLLGDRVEPRCRLVEHHQRRAGEQRPRQSQQLRLAAGQAGLGADLGVEPVRQPRGPAAQVGVLERLPEGGVVGRHRAEQRQVVVHRRAEDDDVLGHHGDAAAQLGRVDVAQVDAAERHPSLVADVPEPGGQPADRGLARTGASDEPERRAGRDHQVQRAQRRWPHRVGERHRREAQLQRPVGQQHAVDGRRHRGRRAEHVDDPVGRRHRGLALLEVLGQRLQRPAREAGEDPGRQDLTGRDLAVAEQVHGDAEHRDRGQPDHRVGGRELQGGTAGRRPLVAHPAAGEDLVPPQGVLTRAVRPQVVQRAEPLLDVAVQGCGCRPLVAGFEHRQLAHRDHHGGADRQSEHQRQAEQRVQHRLGDRRAGDQQPGEEPGRSHLRGEHADVGGVAVDPLDQLAGRAVAVPGRVEGEDVLGQPAADAVADLPATGRWRTGR